MTLFCNCSAAVLLVLTASPLVAGTTLPSFRGLLPPALVGFVSSAAAVSGDGSTVVGQMQFSAGGFGEPFRWTETDGSHQLGTLSPTGFRSGFASGVSEDGSLVVGSSASDNVIEAFTWTIADGMLGLSLLNIDSTTSNANAVSGNGSVIVGENTTRITDPELDLLLSTVRWDTTRTIEELQIGQESRANDVSLDGISVVGSADFLVNPSIPDGYVVSAAYLWTEADGVVRLGTLPNGQDDSSAFGANADGTVVVGFADSPQGNEAFRWTQATGMVGLGDIAGGDFRSLAHSVSANGNIVVGSSESDNGDEAFIWDAQNGMRNLQSVLENNFGLGDELAGWMLTAARDVSNNGQVIVGTGINPQGVEEAWIATIPEPTVVALLMSGLFGLNLRRRCH